MINSSLSTFNCLCIIAPVMGGKPASHHGLFLHPRRVKSATFQFTLTTMPFSNLDYFALFNIPITQDYKPKVFLALITTKQPENKSGRINWWYLWQIRYCKEISGMGTPTKNWVLADRTVPVQFLPWADTALLHNIFFFFFVISFQINH